MSAANSLDTKPKVPNAERRLAEPSMEEILSSIRRIIADDQTRPGHGATDDREPEASLDPAEPSPDTNHAGEPLATPVMVDHALVEPRLEADHGHVEASADASSADIPEKDASVYDEAPAEDYSSEDCASPAAAAPAPAQGVADPMREDEAASSRHEPSRIEAPKASESLSPAIDGRSFDSLYSRPMSPPDTDATPMPSDALFSAATHQSVGAAFRALAATRLTDNSEELLEIARDMIKPLLKTWIDNNVPSMVERMVRAEIERVSRGGR